MTKPKTRVQGYTIHQLVRLPHDQQMSIVSRLPRRKLTAAEKRERKESVIRLQARFLMNRLPTYRFYLDSYDAYNKAIRTLRKSKAR